MKLFGIARQGRVEGNEIYVLVCPSGLQSQESRVSTQLLLFAAWALSYTKRRVFTLVLLANGYSDSNASLMPLDVKCLSSFH